MKEKRLENSGIPSSDLLKRFPISISIENAGGFIGREKDSSAGPWDSCIRSIKFGSGFDPANQIGNQRMWTR